MLKETLKRNKGITLIALVVTIVVLLILVGISIGVLFGDNGIISMAQRAKKEYEEASKKEQQQLAGIFGKDYVEYNGKLSVKNGKLTNQYGETVVLRGMSAGNGSKISLTEKYYNKEALSNVKAWGSNVFRIPVDTDAYYNGYVSNPDIVNRVFEIADICIDLDMYVVIDWHVLYEGNPNNHVEQSKEFFTQVATKYKNVPNVIYEICNEPNGDGTTWEEIKKYANEVIPIIRNISKEAIIITGTPGHSVNIDDVINSELEYENIMYTCHMYADSFNQTKMSRLKDAIDNNIPVFVTEWGCASQTDTGSTLLANANIITNYMKENNISWCNWYMGDIYGPLALVKQGEWNNSLNDNILSESGKYVKKLLQNMQIENLPVMMEYAENYAFWNNEYRDKITNIVVEDIINEEKISNAIKTWDVSFVENSKKVIAYIEDDGNQLGTYTLYISGNGGVYSPPSSRSLFSNFINLKTADFSKLNTSNTNNMTQMFEGNNILKELNIENFETSYVEGMDSIFNNCSSLENLDISSFDTSRLKDLHKMFANCQKLKNINFGTKFTTEKVTRMRMMFYHCESLETLDISTFNTSQVTDMEYMFEGCASLNELNLKNFNTGKVKNMRRMFASCQALKSLDLSTFNTENVTDMREMFEICRNLTNLDLSNFNTSNITDMTNMFSDLNSIQELDFSNATFTQVTTYVDMFAYVKDGAIITVKDSDAQRFIQERLAEANRTATVQIKK